MSCLKRREALLAASMYCRWILLASSTKIPRFAYHHRFSLAALLYDRQRINPSGLLRLDAFG